MILIYYLLLIISRKNAAVFIVPNKENRPAKINDLCPVSILNWSVNFATNIKKKNYGNLKIWFKLLITCLKIWLKLKRNKKRTTVQRKFIKVDIISKIMVHVFIKTPLRIDLLRAKKAKSFKDICEGVPFTVKLQAVGAILLKNKLPHIYFSSILVRFAKQRFLEIHLVCCFFFMKKNPQNLYASWNIYISAMLNRKPTCNPPYSTYCAICSK